ncbi:MULTISPECIES: DUF6055 domain-containing protein [Chitinophagaceae]
MFDACCHFVNWNLPRIQEVARPYAHLHHTKLKQIEDGWYEIDSANCPQNFGYNAIPFELPGNSRHITLHFNGEATSLSGFRKLKTDQAGWCYGFVTEKENGETVYSPIYSNPNTTISYAIPKAAKYCWLVIMDAPKSYWTHPMVGKTENDEQWPYRFQLKGVIVK